METPCSYIGTPIKVGWEDTPQLGSFLDISLGPISDAFTPNTGVFVGNSTISIRVMMT